MDLAKTDLGSAFLAVLDQADAYSFDVFDTLFVRPLCDPEDAFDMIGERHGITGFRDLRRRAQALAFDRMRREGRAEITLDDIYDGLDTHAPSAVLKQYEYDLELALTQPNPEIMDLFKAAAATGKPVVLTSDMYLPLGFFEDLVRRHGLGEAVQLFISSDRNATKRDSGALFDIVAQSLDLPPGRILHIGDNPQSDIAQARARGLQALHYSPARTPAPPAQPSTSASLATGLVRPHGGKVAPDTLHEIGYRHGGPAAFALQRWVDEQAGRDQVDLILFVSRDGFVLERIAVQARSRVGPPFAYFEGSRIAFALAAMTEANFDRSIGFLLSGSPGLSPLELFERIGVEPPADHVMDDLGMGAGRRIEEADMADMARLLTARKWEILKVCRRNRRGLFLSLRRLGVRAGMRLALVDIGWNGTTQEALRDALEGMIDVELIGYYFCLTDSPERRRRAALMPMRALISSNNHSPEALEALYENRVAAELFFSAPHDAVIGYSPLPDGASVCVMDKGRGDSSGLSAVVDELTRGMADFAADFADLCAACDYTPSLQDIAQIFVSFVTDPSPSAVALLHDVRDFDAWGSTRNGSDSLTSGQTQAAWPAAWRSIGERVRRPESR